MSKEDGVLDKGKDVGIKDTLFHPSPASNVSACNLGDLGSIPGSGRSPGEGNGNPLQYSCLDRGAL